MRAISGVWYSWWNGQGHSVDQKNGRTVEPVPAAGVPPQSTNYSLFQAKPAPESPCRLEGWNVQLHSGRGGWISHGKWVDCRRQRLGSVPHHDTIVNTTILTLKRKKRVKMIDKTSSCNITPSSFVATPTPSVTHCEWFAETLSIFELRIKH